MGIKPLVIGDLTAPIPVIQGGMGVGISLSGLAGAVAKAGGIGIISTAQIGYREEGFDKDPIGTNLSAIKKEIDKAREIAPDGIIGVNIMVATRNYEEYVRAAAEAGADVIISGAGLPMTLPEVAGHTRAKLAPVVSSAKSSDVICKYWKKKYNRLPDFVVIEGPLAGGHLGFSMEQLSDIPSLHYDDEVKKIIAHVNKYAEEAGVSIPVVVAGGIYERADMEHYLELGAAGVQVATRFVTTYECDAHEAYKMAYINAKKEDIRIVKSPVGMPGRAIRNAFIENIEKNGRREFDGPCHICIARCDRNTIPYCITEALVNAAKGKVDDALLFCGANAWRADKLEHVDDIMKEFA